MPAVLGIAGGPSEAANQTPPAAPQPNSADELSSNAAKIFFGSQVVLGAILLFAQAPRLEGDIALLVMLICLNVGAQFMPISIYGASTISVGFVFTLAIIIFFGVPGAVLVAPIAAVCQRLGRRHFDYKALTNGARFVIINGLAAAVFGFVSETNPQRPDLEMIAGSILATVVCFSLSVFLIVVSSHLRTGASLSSVWENNRWTAPHYVAMGIIGIALASAYIALGIVGLAAFLAPVLMMRISMWQYVDKTKENVEKLEQQNAALTAANIEVMDAKEELRESYDGTLEALVNALDARDQETKGHSVRVSRYMLQIACALGVVEGSKDWIDMGRGSLLHDVGKIGVSDSILLKPGKLTDDEWLVMRKHPEIGYHMLHQVSFLQGAAEIILCHHERFDGEGYPRRLAGEDIPLGARIFSVVDTFDSMTSDRPYRRALTTMEALNEILKYSGSQFDPLVVEAFLDTYETWVKERQEMHSEEGHGKLILPRAA